MIPQRLAVGDVHGVFAIMPTPATEDAHDATTTFTVASTEAKRGANALVEDGVDAIMINGTFGEAATLTRREWESFTETVIDAVDGRLPVLAGPTTLDTRSTIERAAFAADKGADGMLLGRPMWCEMSSESIVEFYRTVASEVPELGIVIYDNPGAFKGRIGPETWRTLAEIPQVIGAKYAGMDDQFHEVVSEIGDRVRVMPMETNWLSAYRAAPDRVTACWSGGVSCGPKPVLRLRDFLEAGQTDEAEELTDRITATYDTFMPEGNRELFGRYNIPLEKARFNGAGYIDAGPVRPPYHVIPDRYADGARVAGRRWAELAESL